jgi:DUF1365 family protein
MTAGPDGSPASGLYRGVTTHARFRPRVHRLRYRLFMLLIDLDEAEGLSGRLKLFGYNRPALFSLRDRDHLAGRDVPLRRQVDAELTKAGIDLDGGPIRLMCMPRVLGFVFNPISVYFCHRADGALGAVLYEVNNTFGQRHSYLIAVRPEEADAEQIAQSCDKHFHVSPFMDMAMRYHFKVAAPGETVCLIVDAHDAEGPKLAAAFTGRRAELSDRVILKTFAAHPLLALAVLAGIHWEAVKLLLKGLRLQPNPPAPAEPVTVVR